MAKLQNKLASTVVTIAATFWLVGSSGMQPIMAAGAGSATDAAVDPATEKDVASMETRFFSRRYINDPMDKRIERLELLVFGQTKDGDVATRYARLKKAIASRDTQNSAAGGKATASGKGSGSSTNYPAVTALESRVLKKTYPAEPLSTRLSRLEKKVFGTDNPTMAYADRVDRLKRMMQGAIAAQQPVMQVPIGPGPKAHPRGQDDPGFTWHKEFSYSIPQRQERQDDGDDSEDGGSFFGMPELGMGLPNGLGDMMRQMERQMRQMEQSAPPGSWTYDPKSGSWVDSFTGKHFRPGGPQDKQSQPPAQRAVPKSSPFHLPPSNDNELPPYSDPNSI